MLMVKNFIVDDSNFPKALMYGDFRIHVYLYKPDDTMIACVKAFVISKPKSQLTG